jgi:hypothetical protein
MLIVEENFAQNSVASDNEKTRPVQLFNGGNLDGWYTFLKDRGRDSDPKKVFTEVKLSH